MCCNFLEVVIGDRVELHGDAGVFGSPSPVSSPSPMLCNKANELTNSLVWTWVKPSFVIDPYLGS